MVVPVIENFDWFHEDPHPVRLSLSSNTQRVYGVQMCLN